MGSASSQPGEVTPTIVPVLSGSANLPSQKPVPVPPGSPETQKTEEEVSKTQGDQKASLGTLQWVADNPRGPRRPSSFSYPIALDSEHSPGCSSAPCDEVACIAKEPHGPPKDRVVFPDDSRYSVPGIALSTCFLAGQEVHLFGLCSEHKQPPCPLYHPIFYYSRILGSMLCPSSSDFLSGLQAAPH